MTLIWDGKRVPYPEWGKVKSLLDLKRGSESNKRPKWGSTCQGGKDVLNVSVMNLTRSQRTKPGAGDISGVEHHESLASCSTGADSLQKEAMRKAGGGRAKELGGEVVSGLG